nr:MAG TPA: hypothetical protein [Caudoviricetes sp.]
MLYSIDLMLYILHRQHLHFLANRFYSVRLVDDYTRTATISSLGLRDCGALP